MKKSKISFVICFLMAPALFGNSSFGGINANCGQDKPAIKTSTIYISERLSSIRNEEASKYAWNPIKAVNEGNEIYILDRSWCSILIFNSKGKYLNSFGSKGQGPAEFSIPVDINICNGRIYVLDNGNYAVKVFDLNGKYQLSFKTYKSYRGIAINPNSNTIFMAPIIVDRESKIIDVFNDKGEYLRSFGEPIIEGDRGLNAANMAYLSYMKDNKIIVSYDSNREVRVFEESGKEIYRFKVDDERMMENEKYNKGYFSRTSKQNSLKTVTYGLYVNEKNVYILQAFPDLKIYMFDERGNCLRLFIGDKKEKCVAAGFYVRNDDGIKEFYILSRDPEVEIVIFRPRN